MKIAITSASGQLGRAITRHVVKAIGSENVVAIARTPSKLSDLNLEVRKGDYNRKEDFQEALKGIDKVLLISGMDQPHLRIQQHRNVIEAALQNGVKKMVYTSIVGDDAKTDFSPVVQSNRQTEEDIKNTQLEYAIGRNGIYIEPDLEYIETYQKIGKITNCAADQKCAYTSREELGYAYAQMLLNDELNGQTLNLVGEGISQAELAALINRMYGTNLHFEHMSFDSYKVERQAELGDFIGTVIAGIYQSIAKGAYDLPSDFEKAAGRPHKSPLEMILEYRGIHS